MYTRDDVTKLAAEIDKLELNPPIEKTGKSDEFGLGLDIFDPVSGQIITAARPHRSDIGQPEILLTAAQVGVAVAQARSRRVHEDRAKGIVNEEDAEAAAERQKAALATKEADAKEAEAARVAAAKGPNPAGAPKTRG
jgi:hypothetical protein